METTIEIVIAELESKSWTYGKFLNLINKVNIPEICDDRVLTLLNLCIKKIEEQGTDEKYVKTMFNEEEDKKYLKTMLDKMDDSQIMRIFGDSIYNGGSLELIKDRLFKRKCLSEKGIDSLRDELILIMVRLKCLTDLSSLIEECAEGYDTSYIEAFMTLNSYPENIKNIYRAIFKNEVYVTHHTFNIIRNIYLMTDEIFVLGFKDIILNGEVVEKTTKEILDDFLGYGLSNIIMDSNFRDFIKIYKYRLDRGYAYNPFEKYEAYYECFIFRKDFLAIKKEEFKYGPKVTKLEQ